MKNRVLLTLLFSILLLAGCVGIDSQRKMNANFADMILNGQGGKSELVQFKNGDGAWVNSVPSFSFSSEGGEKTLSFKTSYKWSIDKKSIAEWINLSKTSGNAGIFSLAVRVQKNLSNEARESAFYLKSGDYTYRIKIAQAADDVVVEVYKDPEGNNYVEVSSDPESKAAVAVIPVKEEKGLAADKSTIIEVSGIGTVTFNAEATNAILANAEAEGATNVYFKVEDVTTTKPVPNADVVLEVTMKTVDENGVEVYREGNAAGEVTVEIPLKSDVVYVNDVTLVDDEGNPLTGGVVDGSVGFDEIKHILSFKVKHFSKYAVDYVTKDEFVSVTGVNFIAGLILPVGAEDNLSNFVTITPDNATNKNVTWSSDNTDVATVDNEGNVHAVSEGSATITVTTTDGGKTATCAVTVFMPVNTVTKIADYLYEYTAEGYDTEAPSELQFDDGPVPIFGCSAVRNGNFFGRNFDYNINETCEFVVRTRATETRPHASIGVANTCFLNITNDMVKAGLSETLLKYIPWMTMDGINDAGLVCNINVVNAADIKENPHKHTNEGAQQIMVMQLVRALLDNCGSVAEAKTYIEAHDIRPIPTTWDGHIMIADPNETVIVEFTGEKGNEVKFVKQTRMIMTNFYNHLFKEADFLSDRSINNFPKHSCGMERYFILSDNYATGNSMQGMWDLLRKVRYTQAYDTSVEPFWCSEYYDDAKIPTFDDHEMSYWTKEKVLAEEKPAAEVAAYAEYAKTGEYNEEDGLWHTTHNSTYDITNKTLWVTIREKYEKHYEFTLKVDSWGSGSISNFNVTNDDPSKWE